jgi:diacylglycerol kinase (ATP)
MRATAIFGPGCSAKNLRQFQTDKNIEWQSGMPSTSDQADLILLFGGDGTIHGSLEDLVKLQLPVLVVPTGSGNDFARALNMRRVRDSMAAWRRFCATRDNVRTIDLGAITPLGEAEISPRSELCSNSVPGTQNYFCSVAGIGLDAEVSRRANALPRWLRGHGGYALTLIPAIFRFAPFRMSILGPDIDGPWAVRSDQPTILAAFANTPIYGGGMKIAPHAQMDDGQLDVCVIGGISSFKLACMFPTVYFGHHLGIREVTYFKAAHVRVETEIPLNIYADGEYICRAPADITIKRAALKVLTP